MECMLGRGEKCTDFVSQRPVYINNCGYIRKLDKDVKTVRPNGRADYHFIFNASGEISVNGETVNEGELYVVLPWERQEYTYHNKGKELYYWIHFSGTMVGDMLKGLSIHSGKYDLAESKGDAEDIFRKIINGITSEWEGSDDYLAGQLYSLMALISAPRKSSNPFAKAIRILNDCSDRSAVGELASMYNMSEGHFIRQFRSYTGHTPLEYKMMKRMESARSLLSATDMSVTDISALIGFDDPLYFSRAFKKYVGISPRDYRKKYI